MKTFLITALVVASGTAQAVEQKAVSADVDTILRAASDELGRYKAIKVGTLDAPYYLSTTIDDEESFSAMASFGALKHKGSENRRVMHVDVRVGSMELDNKNFSDRDHPSFVDSMMADMSGGPVPL